MSIKKYILKLFMKLFSYFPSEIKLYIYKILGANIGKNVELGFGSLIIPFDSDFKKIRINDNVTIRDNVTISGKNIFFDDWTEIKNNTVVWGQSDITMGKHSYIDQHCLLDLRRDIVVEDGAGIGANSWLYTHGVWHSILDGAPTNYGPIFIRKNAWVAANVFIMPNITIGEDAIVGARAVITKNVGQGCVVAGNPAKEIAKTDQITKKLTLEDKVDIVKDILSDFGRVYDNKFSHFKNMHYGELFNYWGGLLAFIPDGRLITIDDLSNMPKKELTLVSFYLTEEIQKYCKIEGIGWFDLEFSTCSENLNEKSHYLQNFFGGYGIVFQSSGG
ncbi:MAG: hypothetical protein JXA08_09410 [Methanomicrobiaceae archaeon]|nr:hypothetical protein [Methanomicrobiaceae archaeon]